MIRVDERVKAIQGDMIHTGEYIAERFHDQNIYLQEHHAAIGDALKSHQSGIGDALTTHHENTAQMIVYGIVDGALEYVSPEFTPLGAGKVLLWMNSTASVFYLDAVATNGDIERKQSKLVNFGFC